MVVMVVKFVLIHLIQILFLVKLKMVDYFEQLMVVQIGQDATTWN